MLIQCCLFFCLWNLLKITKVQIILSVNVIENGTDLAKCQLQPLFEFRFIVCRMYILWKWQKNLHLLFTQQYLKGH